jgi:signal transduction histidine kinase/CheY-like chemotaxis protein
MFRSQFKYLLLAIFLTAILLIVFIQFNSNRSINQLINGNESLIHELETKNKLQQLENEIATVENKIRTKILQKDTTGISKIRTDLSNITITLTELDSMVNDKSTDSLVSLLQKMVNEKVAHNKSITDTFQLKGKEVTEKMFVEKPGHHLTDSIRNIVTTIENKRHETVTQLTTKADADGARAKALGSILALMAALAALMSFGYISFKFRQQQQLIRRLNISEKKATEAAQLKENFMANMSHEIRTPMNAIIGFTSLLQKKQLDKEAKEYVETIHHSGENLLTIINDVLDLSKIEAGMMRIESVPFNLMKIVDGIETMFSEKLKEKELAFTADVDESVPKWLMGDAVRLNQILVNLVGNSVKFTRKGSILLKVIRKETSAEHINLQFIVRDTGIGMNKEKLTHIFERFNQAEDTITRTYGGSGLGLAIVKDLVELQQGQIEVESKPESGSTFYVTLPYKLAKEMDVAEDYEKHFVSSGIKASILVVEDNEINQSLIRHLFNSWNLSYVLAVNGKEAVEILKHQRFDLILMDIQMPEMDGYTTTQLIRNELQLHTPVIAMTAHALAGEKEKCISSGMNDYLSKPIREEQLHDMISMYTEIPVDKKNPSEQVLPLAAYKYINLQYMKEISAGNKEYEQVVTEQFLEIIPASLAELQQSFANGNYQLMKRTAHDLKTSVSIMGLTTLLETTLHEIEYSSDKDEKLQKNISHTAAICNKALEEARIFYSSLTS